ncbi:hypothetical protein [Candidatus Nitrosotalea sp. TS]|uniref:hypothetical protein n=2 Tax=Candidatus Nitrosotalea sp. TS TaxID=2341020 RepID=UPI001C49B428|nr:hypothetical protein [Candidatus Nitrosotalea sp. TS]
MNFKYDSVEKFNLFHAYWDAMKFAILGCVMLLVASSSPAWAAFDTDGNYYCNSSNLPLEETIYKSSVAKIDSDLNSYLSLNPSATDQELHSYLISDPEVAQPYSIMEQSKACLQSNGVSPNAIVSPSSLFLEVFAAPEFGIVSGLVFGITLASVVVLQNKINKSILLKI